MFLPGPNEATLKCKAEGQWHIRSHIGEKTYKRDFCDEMFTEIVNLVSWELFGPCGHFSAEICIF